MTQVIDPTHPDTTYDKANPPRVSETRLAIRQARRWAAALTLAFVAVAGLAALGVTDGLDLGISRLAQDIGWEPLDLVASLFNIAGQMEVTALVALVLACVWWRRDGARGLVALLLFAGVAIEVVLKHVVRHPGPPEELSRSIRLLPFIHSSSPYSFPSGHMIRVTFLAALLLPRWGFWALIAAMAATRIYLQEHWASDVIGGFLLGAALAGVAASLFAEPEA